MQVTNQCCRLYDIINYYYCYDTIYIQIHVFILYNSIYFNEFDFELIKTRNVNEFDFKKLRLTRDTATEARLWVRLILAVPITITNIEQNVP